MSHFSRIKTSIRDFIVLQKTLEDLRFQYSSNKDSMKDSYGNLQDVDLIIKTKSNDTNLLGFVWDGHEYNLVVDLQFWDYSMSVERFMDRIIQQYALNSVLRESVDQGFNQISQESLQDGSIKLVIQRWH